MAEQSSGLFTKFEDEYVSVYAPRPKEDRVLWPCEVMLRTLFGRHLERKVEIEFGEHTRVLDVGCGTGNNLRPFLHKGCQAFGTEVTEKIARQTQDSLSALGFESTIKSGQNLELPFEDGYFDLVTSVNVLHYEKDEASIKEALKEYARVLKPDGVLFVMTAGQEHDIYKRATALGDHRFRISDWDFRDGEQFFYFSNLKYLEFYLSQFWDDVELGETLERLPKITGHFLFAVCRKKR
jgi:SAM-dependent methyltransferase